MSGTVLWYRQDLRTADHVALVDASARGPVVPVFVWHPAGEGRWPVGGAQRWWLHHSLRALDADDRVRALARALGRGEGEVDGDRGAAHRVLHAIAGGGAVRTAVDRVGAATGRDDVVAAPAVDGVGPAAGGEEVVARPAGERVGAVAAGEPPEGTGGERRRERG